jgi:hypothetical protein
MGEEGNDTLGKIFTERFGSGSGWSQRSPAAMICGEREEGRKTEEERKKSPTEPV